MKQLRTCGVALAGIVLSLVGSARAQSACQVVKLSKNGGESMGVSLAVAGDVLVAGAGSNDTKATDAGAAHVYVFSAGQWVFRDTLYAVTPTGGNDAVAGDSFGIEVATDGETILVGAPFKEDPNTPGVTSAGTCYVFERDDAGTPGLPLDDTWDCVQQLWQLSPNTDPNKTDFFGYELLVDGDTAVVAAPTAAKAYVFDRVNGVWPQHESHTLTPGDTSKAQFGFGLALQGSTLFVGQRFWGSDETPEVGRVHVFEKESSWVRKCAVQPAATDVEFHMLFGNAIDADGDSLAIGAHSSGLAPSQKGVVFIFRRSPVTGWCPPIQEAKLAPAANEPLGVFGVSVDLEADRLLAGAYEASMTGKAHVFERAGTTWSEVLPALVPVGGSNDYGIAVALQGDTAVIGAREDDALGFQSGAVFVHDLHAGATAAYGLGCPGSGGLVPELSIAGCPSPTPGNALHFAIASGASGAFPLLLMGLVPAAIPVPGTPGCSLLVTPIIARIPFPPLSPAGAMALDLVPPASIPAGASVTLQVFLYDAGLTTFYPYSSTNAVQLTFY